MMVCEICRDKQLTGYVGALVFACGHVVARLIKLWPESFVIARSGASLSEPRWMVDLGQPNILLKSIYCILWLLCYTMHVVWSAVCGHKVVYWAGASLHGGARRVT